MAGQQLGDRLGGELPTKAGDVRGNLVGAGAGVGSHPSGDPPPRIVAGRAIVEPFDLRQPRVKQCPDAEGHGRAGRENRRPNDAHAAFEARWAHPLPASFTRCRWRGELNGRARLPPSLSIAKLRLLSRSFALSNWSFGL